MFLFEFKNNSVSSLVIVQIKSVYQEVRTVVLLS